MPNPTWQDGSAGGTPINAAALNTIEADIAAKIPKSLVDAKGDLIVATAADTVARRAVGSNGQVLTADSAQADGVKWADVPADTRYALTSDVNVVNTTTETAVVSQSIGAGVMGTDKMLRCTIIGDYLNDSGAGRTFTLRVKFGGSTLYADVSPSIGADSNRAPFRIDIVIGNQSASDQVLEGEIFIGTRGAATSGIGDLASVTPLLFNAFGADAAINTANAQTFEVSVEHAAANASLSFRKKYARIEIV